MRRFSIFQSPVHQFCFATSTLLLAATSFAQEETMEDAESAAEPAEAAEPEPEPEAEPEPELAMATEPPVEASEEVAVSAPVELAPEEKAGPPTTLDVSLNQDAFFGFYAFSQLGVGLSDTVDLTFYSIQWTIPFFGTGPGQGQGLWTEFGAGANFNVADGALSINPQVGLLSGMLLSGGLQDAGARPLALEGIVPNLTISLDNGLLEGQLYSGLYLALRESEIATAVNNDYLHYWLNFGVAPTSYLSAGLHWEHLARLGRESGTSDLYMWLGPYIEAKHSSGGFLRFSAGVDLVNELSDTGADGIKDFYKMTTGISF